MGIRTFKRWAERIEEVLVVGFAYYLVLDLVALIVLRALGASALLMTLTLVILPAVLGIGVFIVWSFNEAHRP